MFTITGAVSFAVRYGTQREADEDWAELSPVGAEVQYVAMKKIDIAELERAAQS